MELTTSIIVHYKETPKDVSRKANELKDTILSFAALRNYAFWDAESAEAENCVLVYGTYYEPQEAKHIKCDDIEKELMAWCCEVADCLHDVPDKDSECGSYDVKIVDIGFAGGMCITCSREGEKAYYVLWVLPITKDEEGGAK